MKTLPLLIAMTVLSAVACTSNHPAPDALSVKDSGTIQPSPDTPIVSHDTGAVHPPLNDTIQSEQDAKADARPKPTSMLADEVSYTGEQAIIYKTKKDYSSFVPVTMNDDKTKVVAYPSPKDVFYKGKLALPETLDDGYLLDNRGITANTVFLNMTYKEYAKLKQAPKLSDMLIMIEDKDPITEIYSLGTRSRFIDEKKEINDIISRKALKKFRKIK